MQVASKHLAAGSYVVYATANLTSSFPFGGHDLIQDTVCELHNGAGFIGGATDRRMTPSDQSTSMSLSLNGGAQVPDAGGDVSLWCREQDGGALEDAQIMILKVAGFF